MRKRALLGASLALVAFFAMRAGAQTPTSAAPAAPAATQGAPGDCVELDEDEEASAAEIDREKSFFDEFAFACEADWLQAEQNAAPVLRKLGQESFRQYEDREDDLTLRLRRVSRYEGGDFALTRIDCAFVADEHRLNEVAKGGKVLHIVQNRWKKADNGRWELRLGAADCAFIAEWFEEFDPGDIEGRLPFDPEGAIILHGGETLTEFVDTDGFYSVYARDSAARIANPTSDAVENRLDQLLTYLRGRAKESRRRPR